MRTKEANAQWLLLVAVFIIATCGLIYELVAGTLASYLLGDSVTQFSTIIGVYLFSMGIGSFLSKYFNDNLLQWFVRIELLVGLVGGFSAAILFLVFPIAGSFRIILYALVGIIGILVGLEIPILMRILKDKVEFKELVSRVFTFDYIGALLASLVFPLLLVPHLGLIRTALFFGILNIAVGWYLAFYFSKEIRQAMALKGLAVFLLLVELIAFVFSENIMSFSETMTYNDHVVYSTSSPYQRIVLTRNKRELRLFLNGNLQFSSADEYRYHEALVHPALSSVVKPRKVLVLGGGDGLAVREILKYPSVEAITLVDLDPVMTRLFTSQEILIALNDSSLLNKKVKVHNEDAFTWLRNNKQLFDAVIVDFPDPSNFSIGKLYSTVFYQLLRKAISPTGLAVIQSTSPYVAPKSFWCIDTTIQSAGLFTKPYHNYVPSFGEWGYIIAMPQQEHNWFVAVPPKMRFLNPTTLQQMLTFPEDMKAHQPLQLNKLNNQALVGYFEEEWNKYLD
ncbi:MAG: polyamine aminopropyltransferase [Bacteroidota bacterium]